MPPLGYLLAGGLLLAAELSAAAGSVPARVVRVVHIADGDTVTVLDQGRRYRVDIAGIDAPEMDQPHGQAARRALAALTFNRTVRLVRGAGDAAGSLYADGRNVAETLLDDGHAWALPATALTALYAMLETRARARGRGLWGLAAAIAPWSWREGRRSAMTAEASTTTL